MKPGTGDFSGVVDASVEIRRLDARLSRSRQVTKQIQGDLLTVGRCVKFLFHGCEHSCRECISTFPDVKQLSDSSLL